MTATTDCTTPAAAEFTKTVTYDRFERNYRAELNGEIKGYYASYFDAEQALDALVYELLAELPAPVADEPSHADTPTATLPTVVVVVSTYDQDEAIETFTCGTISLSLGDDGGATLGTKRTLIDLGAGSAALPQLRQLGAIFHHPNVTRHLDQAWGDEPNEAPYTVGDGSNDALKEYEGRLYRALVRCGLQDDQVRDVFGHVKEIADCAGIGEWVEGCKAGREAVFAEFERIAGELKARKAGAPTKQAA